MKKKQNYCILRVGLTNFLAAVEEYIVETQAWFGSQDSDPTEIKPLILGNRRS